jgi:DNA-directed RNA polymerase specialized sigma subunit
MCRLICKARTVRFHGPLPLRAGAAALRIGRLFVFRGHGERRNDLYWHNGSAVKKLTAEEQRMAEEYRAAGMTEEQIAEIAAFDREVLRSDRRFYRHMQACSPVSGSLEQVPEPAYDGSDIPLSGRMDWLQEIEDPALLQALRELKPDMLEILTLYVFDGLSQPEIARKLGCTRQNISGRIVRLRRFLKRRTGRK